MDGECCGYRLERKLGEGARGDVYLGVHALLGRKAAIKVLRPSLLPTREEQDRFVSEGRLLSALDRHPNVVQVENCAVGERTCLVVEFVEGESLRALLLRESRLAFDRGLDIARQLAEGLAHVHRHGIVHGDLKPENVLVTGTGVAKVADFGEARVPRSAVSGGREPGETRTWPSPPEGAAGAAGALRGTPLYMAPEQLRGEPPGPAADVYAWGRVVYEMLVGRLPEGLRPAMPGEGQGTRGRAFDELLCACLGPDRPRDAMCLVDALAAVLGAPAPDPAPAGLASAGPAATSGACAPDDPLVESPFCPRAACGEYLPSGPVCPRCGTGRSPVTIPPAPGAPYWRANLPGAVATRMALGVRGGRPVLVAAWGDVGRPAPGVPRTGGVAAIDLAAGTVALACELEAPIEGGVAVAGSLVLAGLALGPMGQGVLVGIDLETGRERLRSTVEGAVRSVPAAEGERVWVTACDGTLRCLDARDGRHIRPAVRLAARPVATKAGTVAVLRGGVLHAVVAATYGERDEGKVFAFDAQGRLLWCEGRPAGGHVRGTPAVAGDVVYVTAWRDGPSSGVLSAFDLRTGQPVWPQPFRTALPLSARGAAYLSGSPLVNGDTVYVGCLDHRLYAVDAGSGTLRWAKDVGAGLASAPAFVEGLVVAGASDGRIHALDASSGDPVWVASLGPEARVQTDVLVHDVGIFVGAADGSVAALPWHGGRYRWAAERREREGRWAEAGDLWALLGHHDPARGEEAASRAAEAWARGRVQERAGAFWAGRGGRDRELAAAFRAAGEERLAREPEAAARHLARAAGAFRRLADAEALTETTRRLARCLRVAHVSIREWNVPRFVRGETGRLALVVENDGAAAAPAVRIRLGGELVDAVAVRLGAALRSGERQTVPITIRPSARESTLLVEVEWDTGSGKVLVAQRRVPILAEEPPRPLVQAGDVATLNVTIAAHTTEGVSLITQDVGLVRARGDIGHVEVRGDAGVVRGGGGGRPDGRDDRD